MITIYLYYNKSVKFDYDYKLTGYNTPFYFKDKLTMRLKLLAVLITLSPALVAATSLVATSQQMENTVVISATRSDTLLENTPKTISILTSDDIDNRPGLNGIQSLLAELPGVDYARSGGLGGQLVIRGFNTNDSRSVMAIDGDRYIGRSTLEYNMLDPASIERIEVIRGPVSSLYGSDAMTGVVNIITRRSAADPLGPFAVVPKIRSIGYNSSNNLTSARVELEGGGNGFDILIGGNYSHADDYETPKGKAINSAFHYKGIDLNIGYNPSEYNRWELSARYQYVVTGRAGGLSAAPGLPYVKASEAPLIERYLRLGFKSGQATLFTDSFESTLYIRDFYTDLWNNNYKAKNTDSLIHMQVGYPVVYGGHITASKYLGDHSLNYGSDFYYEDFKSSRRDVTVFRKGTREIINYQPPSKLNRDTAMLDIGLFINDNWQLSPRWVLDGTMRGDFNQVSIGAYVPGESANITEAFKNNNRQSNTVLTGSIGTVYKLTQQLQLTANVSRGFRAPSGPEKVVPSFAGANTVIPSPNLRPETNISGEIGVRVFAKNNQSSLTLYQSNYTNLISAVKTEHDVKQRQNIGKALVRGLELEGQQFWSDHLSSRYSLAYTMGKNSKTNIPLRHIVPLKGIFSLKYNANNWYMEGVVQAYGRKSKIDPHEERKTAGYGLFNFYTGINMDTIIGKQLSDWKLTVGLENIFNKATRNPAIEEDIFYSNDLIGNPLYGPGRAFVVKVSGTY